MAQFLVQMIMDSIVSSLGEREAKLQSLFSRPVRFHLLYKSNDHGASVYDLTNSFDSRGNFVLVLFLQSGSIRGGYTSKSLKYEHVVADKDAFVFEIDEFGATKFPVLLSDKAVQVNKQTNQPTAFGATSSFYGLQATPDESVNSVFFGSALQLNENAASMCANFGQDVVYSARWSEQINVVCTSVELHRVESKLETYTHDILLH